MGYTRRDFMRHAGAVGAGLLVPSSVLALASCEEAPSTGASQDSDGPRPEAFKRPLPQPPVLRPTRSSGSTDFYEITSKQAKAEILPGKRTTIWGYNGSFPGPTIESRSGRKVVIRHVNELPVPISVHLHGGHTPPDSDGYPTDVVVREGGKVPAYKGHADMAPGDFDVSRGHKDYVYPQQQRGATLWYHDHRMDFTGPQVWRGLAGFHLIRDDEDDKLPLPKGDKELLLMITDRSFDGDGQFRYPSVDSTLTREAGVDHDFHNGVMGDTILVNGVPWPFLEVSNTRYRFRILNASNARRYQLALDPAPSEGPHFTQVGSDGGLLAEPVGQDELPVAQAERFDVVIDFGKYKVGDKVTLVNKGGKGPTGQVMRFHVTRKEAEESSVPRRLSDMGEFDALRPEGATERKFEFSGGDPWAVNKKPFEIDRIDADPKLGATEIWKVHTSKHHPVHLHLVQFKILERKGGGIRATDVGWKDTIDLEPHQNALILARFTGYRGKYVFHCHNLEHEDMAMMANIEIQ